MSKKKKGRVPREERFGIKRLLIANVIALLALLLTVLITLAALELLPSIFTFFF